MNIRKSIIIPGAIGVTSLAAAGGSLLASTASYADTAATPTSSQTTTSQSGGQTTQPPQQDWSKAGHQANGKTEALLTDDNLAKAKAAAEAAVSGGTVLRAETDADGDGTYEVHMKNSGGNIVTVFLDSSFKVTSTQDGMGKGTGNPPQGSSQNSGN